jgi:hypothetical protein
MGLVWMGISIICLWRKITLARPLPALPGSASSSSKASPAIRACATSSPQETHPLLSLPPPHLTRSSLLPLFITNPHHQQSTHTTNNSPNKPHPHFTMATLSCKLPLHPMQRVSDDSELLVCCHLPQQQQQHPLEPITATSIIKTPL